MKNGIPYGNGDNTITCTQAEYDAWEQAGTLQQNVTYYITDAPADTTIRDTLISTDTTWSSSKIVNMIYPIGSIFISVSNVNPSTYFTGTSWEAFGSGRTLVGVDTTDTDFDTVEETGGAKTVKLTSAQSGVPSHAHTYTRPTVSSSGAVTNGITGGSHSHNLQQGYAWLWGDARATQSAQVSVQSGYWGNNALTNRGDLNSNVTASATHTHNLPNHTHTLTGGGVANNTASDASQAHTNLQPYITTYMWKRVS